MNTVSKKKTLLSCLLAACMGLSAFAGGMLLKADAESIGISSLVTVTGDAQVEATPRQYVLKNNSNDGKPAGTAVGDTGLYVASTKDDSADGYTVALNGIFTGSVGMQIAFPGEGFWDGSYREAVMTVTSITDPEETFQLHLDDVWGMYAYVTFEYGEETLTRSRSKYYGDSFDQVTGADNADWLYYKNTSDYFFPVMGVFQDAGSEADPRRETAYFGLEMTADGALNVILTSNTNWGAPFKRVLASFAEDPETFVPKTEGQGSTPNLPKLESFKDGYTIRFDISDNANNKACDFLLESIAVSETGDAYRTENSGTVYTLNTETLQTMPSFYQTWYDSITQTADLVTVTGDAQVEATPRQYVLKNAGKDGTEAGTAVGDTGLYVASTKDDSTGYSVALNGIFTGSVGMYVAFPGEGFWKDPGYYREAVMTVTSVTDPEETFQLHIDGSWGTSGYVTYEHEGQKLIRSRSKYYTNPFDQVTGADSADWLYTKSPDYMFPIMSNFNDNSSEANPMRNACYIGLEYTEDGVLNVIMTANTNWGAPFKRVLASFAEEPETFVPSTETSGKTPNLPKLESLKDGYTIRFDISDQVIDNRVDFLLKSIAVSETGDAYRTENSGTVYTLNKSWVEQEPEFYKQWLTFPSITIGQYDKIVAAGELKAPSATYATNGAPNDVKDVETIEYRIDGGNSWTNVADGLISGLKSGNEVEVRYSVSWKDLTISETITFSVRNLEAFAAEDVVNVKEPTVKVTANGQGASGATQSEKGLLLEPTIEQSYSFDFVGRFTGNTEFRWGTAAEEGSGVNGRVEFTVAEAGNPANYFKVIWLSPWQSRAYVEYVYNGTTLYCAQGRNNSGTYFYVLGTGEDHNKDEIADNWDIQYRPTIGDASSSGILGLEWNDDVLNVMAINEDGKKQILASFENEVNDSFKPATSGTGNKSNLPKISFANGYTVSVKVTGAIDFLLYDVTTEEGEISFDTETVAYEPLWYTRGKAMPVFGDIPVLPGVQVDSDTQFTVPALTYTAGEDAELTVAWVKPDNSESETQPGGTLSMTDKGDHIIRYTVTVDGVPYVKELTVHVCDYTTFVSGKPATCISEGEGLFTCVHGNALERVVPADENAHSVSYNEQINPTCTTEGVRACWECLYCHKYFADADCAEELTDLSLPIDPDAHTYWAKWTWDGETPSVEFYCKDCDAEAECTEEIKVVESEEESVDATCQTEGKKVLEASVVFGGYRYIDLHEAVIPVAPHALTAVAEKPSTCMQEGTKAYYICSVCGKLFLDAEGKTETTLEELTIPTGGHQLKEVPAKESTCAEAGNKAYWECSICGKLFLDAEGKTETSKEEVALPTSGQHNMVQVPAKAPTCTEDGNSAYYKCSECGRCTSDDKGEMEIDESSMKLPAAGHKFEGGVCTVCGAEDPGDGASDGLTGGQIAAIVVAAVVVAAGVVVAVVLVVRKKKLGGQK